VAFMELVIFFLLFLFFPLQPATTRSPAWSPRSSHVYETKPGGLIDLKDMLLDG
jgi:hypothetical protein